MNENNLKEKFLKVSFEHPSLNYFKDEIRNQSNLERERLEKAYIGVKFRIEFDKNRQDKEKQLIKSGEVLGDIEEIKKDEKYLEKQINILKDDKQKLKSFILEETSVKEENLDKKYEIFISETKKPK